MECDMACIEVCFGSLVIWTITGPAFVRLTGFAAVCSSAPMAPCDACIGCLDCQAQSHLHLILQILSCRFLRTIMQRCAHSRSSVTPAHVLPHTRLIVSSHDKHKGPVGVSSCWKHEANQLQPELPELDASVPIYGLSRVDLVSLLLAIDFLHLDALLPLRMQLSLQALC
eukprot:1133852-Amphidinium_carterae.1